MRKRPAPELGKLRISGRGLLGPGAEPADPQLPELWRRTLPHDPGSSWDFGRYVPDVVLLELGAHDLVSGRPSRRVFRAALEQWIREVRDAFPEAWIFLVPSLSVTGTWPEGGWGPEWLADRFAEQKVLAEERGDPRIRFFLSDRQEGAPGSVPSADAAAHAAQARDLTRQLRTTLGW